MHCDLKPQNVLISDGNVKLADFGSAQMFYGEDDTLLQHRGTYEFFAPECFKRQNKTVYYSGRAADVWAFGLCVYALTFNKLPFEIGLGLETK